MDGPAYSVEFFKIHAGIQRRHFIAIAIKWQSFAFEKLDGPPILLKRQRILTGERVQNAQSGYDQNGSASVNITLDSAGGKLMSDATRAQRAVAHGRQAMAENNLVGLRSVCIQLAQMLPRDVSEQAQRGWQAGII